MKWIFKKEERIGVFALSVLCCKIVFIATADVDTVVVIVVDVVVIL